MNIPSRLMACKGLSDAKAGSKGILLLRITRGSNNTEYHQEPDGSTEFQAFEGLPLRGALALKAHGNPGEPGRKFRGKNGLHGSEDLSRCCLLFVDFTRDRHDALPIEMLQFGPSPVRLDGSDLVKGNPHIIATGARDRYRKVPNVLHADALAFGEG